jgi:toxin ParE1/3/4
MNNRKTSLIWSKDAENDLFEIWAYLAREASPEIATDQLRAIAEATSILVAWPQSGRARDHIRPGLRSVVASSYVVFYRVVQVVEIVRVLHQRRDIDAMFGGG